MAEPAWPPDFTAWKPDDWSAFGTCLTALIAIGAAIVAWRQVREAARLRREQAEPYVAVWMEESKVGGRFVDVVARNFGATAAYDIDLTFSPPLVRSAKGAEVETVVYVPTIIRTLVPGQEWRSFWDFGPAYIEAKLPDLYDVSAIFYSQAGRRRRRHEYRFQLDWGALRNTRNAVVYGVHDIAKAVREISKQVKKWTEFGKGLSVVVRDGDARDQRRRAEFEEDRRQQRSAEEAEGGSSTHWVVALVRPWRALRQKFRKIDL